MHLIPARDTPENRLARLEQQGVSRRSFLKFCAGMAAVLAVPATHTSLISRALAAAPRLPLVWLAFQDCTGDTESFLRSGDPTVTTILLDLVSLDYHETLMAPSGAQAEKSLYDLVAARPGGYVAVVEGSIPTAANGFYCTIGGRSAKSIAQQVCGSAMKTIAVGACAWDGGWPAAAPSPTAAVGVQTAVPGASLINMPGCPINVVNLTAVIVQYLTYGRWPEVDGAKRPKFAYDEEIHDKCERKEHYGNKRFVLAWGDEGHRKGWCLYKMGCKGPETDSNCPSVRWNSGTSWPIAAGHGCIGCTSNRFWDRMTPIYRELADD
jgi:hydrogenase small subunit